MALSHPVQTTSSVSGGASKAAVAPHKTAWERRFDVDSIDAYRIDTIDQRPLDRRPEKISLLDFIEIRQHYTDMKKHIERKDRYSRSEQRTMMDLFERARRLLEEDRENAVCETDFLFNGVRHIVTPRVSEMSTEYVTAIKDVYFTENIQQNNVSIISAEATASSDKKMQRHKQFRPRSNSKRATNPRFLDQIYRRLTEAELLSGNMKKQMQGRDSFMRQRVLPCTVRNSIRTVVLSNELLPPDAIELPEIYRRYIQLSPVLVAAKRDPVLRAVLTFTRVLYHKEGNFARLHSTNFRMVNLDLDGDTITVCLCVGLPCVLENALHADVGYHMYRPFGHTALTFNQPHHMLIHEYADLFVQRLSLWQRRIWILSEKFFPNTKDRMAGVLLTLSQACRPHVAGRSSRGAYEFLVTVTNLCNELSRTETLPLSSLSESSKFKTIYESGATGDKLIADRLLNNVPSSPATMALESFAQHNTLIASNGSVSENFYTFYQLIQPLQNVRTDPGGSIIYSVGQKKYNLGHVSRFFSGKSLFSDFTVACIDADIL